VALIVLNQEPGRRGMQSRASHARMTAGACDVCSPEHATRLHADTYEHQCTATGLFWPHPYRSSKGTQRALRSPCMACRHAGMHAFAPTIADVFWFCSPLGSRNSALGHADLGQGLASASPPEVLMGARLPCSPLRPLCPPAGWRHVEMPMQWHQHAPLLLLLLLLLLRWGRWGAQLNPPPASYAAAAAAAAAYAAAGAAAAAAAAEVVRVGGAAKPATRLLLLLLLLL